MRNSIPPFTLYYINVLLTVRSPRLELFEEVITLVINEDEGREVDNLNLPDGFHSDLRELNTLDALDGVHGEHSSRTADASEIESAMFNLDSSAGACRKRSSLPRDRNDCAPSGIPFR